MVDNKRSAGRLFCPEAIGSTHFRYPHARPIRTLQSAHQPVKTVSVHFVKRSLRRGTSPATVSVWGWVGREGCKIVGLDDLNAVLELRGANWVA